MNDWVTFGIAILGSSGVSALVGWFASATRREVETATLEAELRVMLSAELREVYARLDACEVKHQQQGEEMRRMRERLAECEKHRGLA